MRPVTGRTCDGLETMALDRETLVRETQWCRSAWLLRCGLAVAIALLVTACDHSEPQRPTHLLVISADSLRVDRLSAFLERNGADVVEPVSVSMPVPMPVPMPTLDTLADRGVTYVDAFTVTPWTAPAMVSVFTGLFPPSHGVQVRDDTTPERLPTLPRLAAQNGLRVGNFSFFSGISYFRNLGLPAPPKGLQHGREPEVFATWLDQSPSEPFFAWIHLLEPHLPYGASGYRAKDLQIEGSSGLEASQLKATVPLNSAEFAPGDRARLLDLYDQDVLRLEERLAELVAALESRDLLEETLIVFVADHGEELLEDGWVGHASTAAHAKLIPEIVRIPMLFSWPGLPEVGSRESGLVQQTDILPSVVDLFGWERLQLSDGKILPGLGKAGLFGGPEREVAFFDSSVGGNLTPDSARADRLQGVTDGICLLSSATAPGVTETVEVRPLRRGVARGICDKALLSRRLEVWRRAQAAQRLETLQQGAADDAPEPEAIDGFEERLALALPSPDEVLTWQRSGGLLSLSWEAQEPVWVQYRVGEGVLAVRGAFKVDQPGGIAFGPFPEGFWNDLAGYSPFRFRILDDTARTRSGWRHFSLEKTKSRSQ